MQMLDTLFGREEGKGSEGAQQRGVSLMMGRPLLSVATQDVIQLQQSPLSAPSPDPHLPGLTILVQCVTMTRASFALC